MNTEVDRSAKQTDEPKQTTCADDHITFLLHTIASLPVLSTGWVDGPIFTETDCKTYIDAHFSIHILDDTHNIPKHILYAEKLRLANFGF